MVRAVMTKEVLTSSDVTPSYRLRNASSMMADSLTSTRSAQASDTIVRTRSILRGARLPSGMTTLMPLAAACDSGDSAAFAARSRARSSR